MFVNMSVLSIELRLGYNSWNIIFQPDWHSVSSATCRLNNQQSTEFKTSPESQLIIACDVWRWGDLVSVDP